MTAIAAAQEQAATDPDGALAALAAVWAEIGGEGGDPLHVVTLAHYAADLEDDPRRELEWDEAALRAAGRLTDERAQQHHATLHVRGFLPSLHLNLAADHAKLGGQEAARAHLAEAEATLDALADDGYGAMIRAGVARLRAELSAP